MLIGNRHVYNKSPGRFLGNVNQSNTRSNFNKSGSQRNIYAGWAFLSEKNSVPNGYVPPYSWTIENKSGGMAIYKNIVGSGVILYGNLAGGVNKTSSIAGSGTVSNAALALIISAIATLSSSGSLTAAMAGKLEASAEILAEGDITGALGAIANVILNIFSSGSLAGGINAYGSMSSEITSFTELSPQSLAANVWNSIASQFNSTGTMGNKLNSAGAAADPWGTVLGSYGAGTAGNIILLIQKILRNKTTTDPLTGTITVYDDDGIATLLTANLF